MAIVELAAAAFVAAVAAGLAGVFFLSAGPLWRDEVDSVNLAKLSASTLWSLLDQISMPPAYPLLLGLAGGWLGDDAAMRLVGLGTAILTIAVTAIVGWHVSGRPPALALALFSMNTIALQTASSLSVYGPGIVIVIVMAGAMWSLARDGGPLPFVVAAAAAVAAVQIQYQNAFHVAAVTLAAAITAGIARRFTAAILALVAGGIAAVSLLPYLEAFARSMSWRVLSRNPLDPPNPFGLVRELVALSGPPVAVAAAIVVLLAVVGVVRQMRSGHVPAPTIYAGAMIVLSVAIVLGAFAVSGPTVMPRHLGALLALLALGIDAIVAHAWSARIGVVAALGVAVIGAPVATMALGMRLTNVDLVARHLEAHARPTDLIVSNPWFVGITLERNYRGATPRSSIPPVPDFQNHRYAWIRERMMDPEPLAPLHAAIAETLRRGGRVWFVGGLAFAQPGQPVPALPPAPASPTQWFDVPYYVVWSMQTGDFARRHSLRWTQTEVPSPVAVSPVESPRILMIEGWSGAP
jgi:hypothetical protein